MLKYTFSQSIKRAKWWYYFEVDFNQTSTTEYSFTEFVLIFLGNSALKSVTPKGNYVSTIRNGASKTWNPGKKTFHK